MPVDILGMKFSPPTILFILLLLLLPAALWLEQADSDFWNSRLAWPTDRPEPNRHTPIYALGTFLPPRITGQLAIGPADNPVVLTDTTYIEETGSLTIKPGTRVYAHEYGQLIVDGQLNSNGSVESPITFTTNEANGANRTWGGIILQPSSRAQIRYTNFRYASPAVSCLSLNPATISRVVIELGTLGAFVSSPACQLEDSIIRSVYDGIALPASLSVPANVVLAAKHKQVITIPPSNRQ